MLRTFVGAALLAGAACQLAAQRPDSIKARTDSIALVRELEAARDTAARRDPTQVQAIQRLLPDISVVGDLVGDFSPEGSTQEDGARLGVREIELALQAAVDPYFRGDVFLGFSDAEGVHIEQAFMTTTAIPGIEARLGRFLMPVTKINTTHRHDLHAIEYPWVVQQFLGAEGLKGTGFYVSRIFAPFGFYQELQLTAVDRISEPLEDFIPEEPPNKDLSGMGFSARLRNYWDLSQAANLELSASALTGKREQPNGNLAFPTADNARQTLFGGDITFRWRPLEQGLYKSFILQAEVLRQENERLANPAFPGQDVDKDGGYVFARYQLSRRLYFAGRYDWLNGATFTAGSGYLEMYPSEFSKLMLAFERTMPSGFEAVNRILLQATFALGPHKPHPF